MFRHSKPHLALKLKQVYKACYVLVILVRFLHLVGVTETQLQ